jgi:hypothetical protein
VTCREQNPARCRKLWNDFFRHESIIAKIFHVRAWRMRVIVLDWNADFFLAHPSPKAMSVVAFGSSSGELFNNDLRNSCERLIQRQPIASCT